MIDTHCHLDFPEFNRDRDEVIIQAAEHGVDRLINIGTDAKTSRFSFSLANSYENIFCTIGVHPHDSKTLTPEFLAEMTTMAENKKVVGIGEIGLDYYRDLSPRSMQKEAFISQLELAISLNLPVVIHVREAMDDALEVVKRYAGGVRGVFHCFPGTTDQARQVIDLGYYISVNGVMTYKNAKMARVAAEVELERILIETDCPFLTPVPHRGKRNVPAYVKIVCAKLAEVRGMDMAEVDKITTRNAEKLFGLVETFG
jgi:TatD DNase family protein